METLGVSKNDAQNAAGCLEGAGFSRMKRGLQWQETGSTSIATGTAIFTVIYDSVSLGDKTPYVLLINGSPRSAFGTRLGAKRYAHEIDKEARYA